MFIGIQCAAQILTVPYFINKIILLWNYMFGTQDDNKLYSLSHRCADIVYCSEARSRIINPGS